MPGKMTKTDLVQKIHETGELPTKGASARVLDATLEAIGEALEKGKEVRIPGWGVFQVKDRKARTARNPRTGDPVHIPARKAITFKAGKQLVTRVNV